MPLATQHCCWSIRFQAWRAPTINTMRGGVDVTISGSQKGLMLPPGISFNALSDNAIAASKTSNLPKSFWAWDEILEANKNGYWPYTPNTNLLYGLNEALDMLLDEGLEQVFARHQRWAAGVRAAVEAWGTGSSVPRARCLLTGSDGGRHA
ncbi:MAG: hypothetical protein MH219_06095 [Marinobacter sp.]|nr:hypothetical protein [Marinobacter sp.]